jgi:hypothetical protein
LEFSVRFSVGHRGLPPQVAYIGHIDTRWTGPGARLYRRSLHTTHLPDQLQLRLLPPDPELQLRATLIHLHAIDPVARPSQNLRPVVILDPLRLAKGPYRRKSAGSQEAGGEGALIAETGCSANGSGGGGGGMRETFLWFIMEPTPNGTKPGTIELWEALRRVRSTICVAASEGASGGFQALIRSDQPLFPRSRAHGQCRPQDVHGKEDHVKHEYERARSRSQSVAIHAYCWSHLYGRLDHG